MKFLSIAHLARALTYNDEERRQIASILESHQENLGNMSVPHYKLFLHYATAQPRTLSATRFALWNINKVRSKL